MRALRLFIFASIFASLLPALPAGAETGEYARRIERARALFLKGKRQYAAGRYQGAIGSFKAAGEIRASPYLDYNVARCREKLGELGAAIRGYRRYLLARPKAPNRQAVLETISALKRAKRARDQDPYADLEAKPPPAKDALFDPRAASPPKPAATPITAPASQPSSKPVVVAAAPRASDQAGIPHEATLPRTYPPNFRPRADRSPRGPGRRGELGRDGRGPPDPPGRGKHEGPLYKQWWFWVGIAGAALISGFIISTATDQGRRSSSSSSALRVEF